MSENDFYVYEYWRLDNNTCFYVGKGKGRRYLVTTKRNSLFTNILNKTMVAVVVTHDNLTENEAFELESHDICKYVFEEGYGINCDGYRCVSGEPYLTNSTWGGEGVSGHSTWKNLNEQEKSRLSKEFSKRASGENNPMYGKLGVLNPMSKPVKIIIDGDEHIFESRRLMVNEIKEKYGINPYGWFDRKYIPYTYKNRVSYCGYIGEVGLVYGCSRKKHIDRIYNTKFIIVINGEEYISTTKKELNMIINKEFGWCIKSWFKRGVPKDKFDMVEFIGDYNDYINNGKTIKCSNTISEGYVMVVDGKVYKEVYRKDLVSFALSRFGFKIDDWLSRKSIPYIYQDRVSYIGTTEEYKNGIKCNKSKPKGFHSSKRSVVVIDGQVVVASSVKEMRDIIKRKYKITGVNHWFHGVGVPQKYMHRIDYCGYYDEYINTYKLAS